MLGGGRAADARLVVTCWLPLGPARRIGSSHPVVMGSDPMWVGTISADILVVDHAWQPKQWLHRLTH
eukprot:373800-Heterocapsa_arctica.AAC.1